MAERLSNADLARIELMDYSPNDVDDLCTTVRDLRAQASSDKAEIARLVEENAALRAVPGANARIRRRMRRAANASSEKAIEGLNRQIGKARAQAASDKAEIARLNRLTSMSVPGGGELSVYGTAEAIRRVHEAVVERDELRAELIETQLSWVKDSDRADRAEAKLKDLHYVENTALFSDKSNDEIASIIAVMRRQKP